MKHKSRRLLSILMAFAMICTLLPAALAAVELPLRAEAGTLDAQNDSTTIGVDRTSDWFNALGSSCTYSWAVTAGGNIAEIQSVDPSMASATLHIKKDAAITSDTTVTVVGTATHKTTNERYTGTVSVVVKANAALLFQAVSGAGSVTAGGTLQASVSLSNLGAGESINDYSVVWSADNTNVQLSNNPSTFSAAGISTVNMTALSTATGRVTLTARLRKNGVEAGAISPVQFNITINPSTQASIIPSNPSVAVGGSTTLYISANMASSYNRVEWSVINGTGSVTYSPTNGSSITLTGERTGSVTVSAKLYNGTSEVASCAPVTVTVTSSAVPTLSVSPYSSNNTYTVPAAGSLQLTASVGTSAGSQSYIYSCNWISGNANAFNVDSTSNYTGVFRFTRAATTSANTSAVYRISVQPRNGAAAPARDSIDITLNYTGATANLTASTSRVNVTSSNWSSRVYVTDNTGRASYVKWSISPSTYAYVEADANYSQAGYTETTYFTGNSRSTGVYVYGRSTGVTTLTAIAYDSGNNEVGRTSVTVDVNGYSGYSLSPSPSNTSSVYLNYYYDDYWWDYDYNYRYSRDFSVTPALNGSSILNSGYYITYSWSVNGYTQSNSNSRYFTLYASNSDLNRTSSRSNTLTCTATIRNSSNSTILATPSVTWNVYTDYYYDNSYTVSATVYDTTGSYYLSERDDKGGSSIITQMENKLSGSETISYVRFHDVTDTYGDLNASTSVDYYYTSSRYGSRDLRDVTFTPDRVGRTGTATFDCTVYGSRGNSYRCTISIKVEAGTSSSKKDVTYTAQAGNNVDFKASDFRSWWRDSYSSGDLDYVRFTSASGGSLYANYNGSNGSNVVSSSGATSCYYSPGSRQTGINDLTFVPSSSSTKSATVRFTAYGTSSSSSSSSTTLSGTVTITFNNVSVAAINYSTTGTKSVSLSSSDFTGRYRDVMGATAPSNMAIRFRSVPANGSLSIGSTTLSSSNISSYNFASGTSGSNLINNVKYTPKSNSNSSDTVNYDCYTGSTLRFSGTINFTNRQESTTVANVTVSYSTNGANVTFNPSDFTSKGSAMLSASYLTFGTPSSGSLYIGDTPAASGAKFTYTAPSASNSATYQYIGSLTYRPAAGFNGTATISFTAYNTNGSQAATGTVNIVVSQPSTPVRTSFADVPANAWFYNDVTTLAQAGIVQGHTDGLFHPNNPVNYGEGLKLILLAAGYPTQTESSGAAWAQNYLNLAISEGLLPGSASDYSLSANMSRTTVATVAAKALKLTPVTSGTSPYTDTNDGYVRALTNTGIVQGIPDGDKFVWKGSDNLTRAQVSRIVYNVYKYRNVAPGSTNTTTTTTTPTIDTDQPSWLS